MEAGFEVVTINSKGKILTSSEEVLFDSEDFKTLSNKIDVVNNGVPHFKIYNFEVAVTTKNEGGYFGQIPLSSCIGYDDSITPYLIIQRGCYAELNSGIHGTVQQSGNNLNINGPVSSKYRCSVVVMYFE